MQLTFHGAAQTVTGSQHLIEVNGMRILLECGLYQGRRSVARKRNRHLPFDPSTVDVMVLSHAHIDHSGNIPNLVKNGFTGEIICTFATRDLCSVMLRDSGHIQERDAEYVNRRKKPDEPEVEPIYTEVDAINALRSFTAIGYDRRHRLADGITLQFFDAGHMLGSAMVVLEIDDEEAKAERRLIFSGDIGQPDKPILRDPTTFDEADILIMEGTYGNRNHKAEPDTEQELKDIINRTAKRGGKVIIPAFSVGRTQQVVYALNRLAHAGEIPNIPVFVDSPLAVNATEVFRLHPETFDVETCLYMSREDPDGDIFGFGRLEYIRQAERSKQLNGMNGPAVIISASGMMEHGRILHHLKHNVEDSRSTILVVGWQAPNTLGRRLVEGEEQVRIFGRTYHPRAEVVTMNGFSGHADHDGLMAWASHFSEPPKQTFIVHAEEAPGASLAADLRRQLGFPAVHTPELHQAYTV